MGFFDKIREQNLNWQNKDFSPLPPKNEKIYNVSKLLKIWVFVCVLIIGLPLGLILYLLVNLIK